ncbi:MAG: IS1380 family transposase [Candidatus Eisenbacteria sp.]|nr:IS1380 family transposase [Candidatus Eisenbacteria bacterium]
MSVKPGQLHFSGGSISSDAGGLVLREVSEGRGLLRRFAECFKDLRDPSRVEHSVPDLLSQRAYGLALGYGDLNDHDDLRRDRLLAILVGKEDPTGGDRLRDRDRGCPLAGKSTLNRLELTPADATLEDRYHKIVYDTKAIDRFFVDVFLESHGAAPEKIILDLDATDDPLHGEQEGRFFHGYYKCYCYLPLYIFCGDHLLCARLRPSNIDASAGSVEELSRIVSQIRERWPEVQIIIRGDSGFAREEIMGWCEGNKVDYIFGLARNARLVRAIAQQLERARRKYLRTGKSSRVYRDFRYRTLKSWSRSRRVVGKAEHLAKGSNPRFVVTSLSKSEYDARGLYEDLYCARGDMENRIKEQQLGLFADRTSTRAMRANQLRLWLSSMAYVLMSELRRVGLAGTELARAQCSTIRTKLLKIGALISVSVRRIRIQCATGYPYANLLARVLKNLQKAYLPIRC